MRLAMIARMGDSGRSSNSTPGATAGAIPRATGAAEAASTSRRTIRPPGPLPWITRRSTPDCAAILRASGEAFRRPPSPDAGLCAAAAGRIAAAGRAADTDGAGAVAGTVVSRGGAVGPAAGEGVRAAGSSRRGCGGTAAGRLAISVAAAAAGAAGPPAPLVSAAMSSSGSAITPMSAPTGTALPAGWRILRRTPAPNASISTSALSVSTSARMSPAWIRSPAFLTHLMILPVSIASESLGMSTLETAISVVPVAVGVADATHRFDDPFLGRRLGALEIARVGHRRGHAGHALDGGVEIVEGLLGDDGGELRAHAREAGACLHHHRSVRLAHRFQDGGRVQRLQRARVHDLD